MSREQLLEMARSNAEYGTRDAVNLAPEIGRVPAWHYYDEDRWALEMKQVFRRLPLMLASTCEIPEPGDYKAMEAAGVPVLIGRGKDGKVNAFLNMCRHRGAVIMPEGRGNSHRFTCPYHAWTYDLDGDLKGVYNSSDFGDLDKGANSLHRLPVLERSGLIWVTLDPNSTLPIESFLCGYDEVLGNFDFANWHFFSQRTVAGPNWKIAYDGYLDFYHLPILHKDTFGSDFPSRAHYYGWGPHQRVSSPNPVFMDTPENEWSEYSLLDGVWTIFPHISIASFEAGGRGVLLSQLFPGETPGESITVQNYLMEKAPADEAAEQAAHEQFDFLKHVVEVEDYATGLRQQKALRTGAQKEVMFGRNEGGGQNFHGWVDRILDTNDEDLPGLFKKD